MLMLGRKNDTNLTLKSTTHLSRLPYIINSSAAGEKNHSFELMLIFIDR